MELKEMNRDDFLRGRSPGGDPVLADRLVEGLNPPQREAVLHDKGPMLILAGAGSGKTRVITHRIAYLVEVRGVAPWSILAITFTNKAAQEMKIRVEELIGSVSQQMWIGTFHSMMARVLRRFADRLGFSSSFTISDTDDQERILKQVIRNMNLDEKMFAPKQVLNTISSAKNKMIEPDQFAKEAGQDFRRRKIGEIYKAYQEALKQGNTMDFDDILVYSVKLFNGNPDVLSLYQERFRYILVDEYQDTNGAQYQLVKLLASAHENLCVVGDDDQSIYSFRGANIQNILDFEKDFNNCKVVKLEQNYRSTSNVLKAANAVIRNNEGRKDKKLWTNAGDGAKITALQAEHQGEEARFIASEIRQQLVKKNIRGLGEVAILYRMNVLSRSLEAALREQGLPYKIYGGLRFYDRKEIKDVLAYLRLIVSPGDDLAFTRIVNVPRRGIGDTSLEHMIRLAQEEESSLFAIAEQAGSYPELSRARIALTGFCDLIHSLRTALLNWEQGLADYIEHVQNASGIAQDIVDQQEKGKEDAVNRIENLKELLSDAVEFEQNPEMDLYDFTEEELRAAGLLEDDEASAAVSEVQDTGEGAAGVLSEDDRAEREASPAELLTQFLERTALHAQIDDLDEGEEAVSLMTVHSSKGLEFQTVFVAGFDEGLFPGMRSMETPDQMEEERRLAYVAITRAREKLYLTTARSRLLFGRTGGYVPSRFLSEIPKDTLHLVGLASRRPAPSAESSYGGSQVRRPAGAGGYGDRPSQRTQGTPTGTPAPQSAGPQWKRVPRPAKAGNASRMPASTLNAADVGKGDAVVHPKFGRGVVLQVEAVAGDAILKIRFDGSGEKRLLLNSAGLSKG